MPDTSALPIDQQIAILIGQQETGGGTAGVGKSLNNPGGLKFADWETQFGAVKTDSGFAKFPSLTDGFAALKTRVAQIISGGSSLKSLIDTWAPIGDGNVNNPQRVLDISKATGLDPYLPIQGQAAAAAAPDAITGKPPTSTSSGGGSMQQVALDALKIAASAIGLPTGVSGDGNSDFTWGRFALFLIGVICLIAGLSLLKQTQIVIEQVQKTAGKVAAAAAVAA